MKMMLLLTLLTLFSGGTTVLATEGADYIEFQKILDSKCSKCHARTRVDEAMAEHRDMLQIEQRMLSHGAELNTQERQVLGIFFRAQEVVAAPENTVQDPLAEYRSVVTARCSGCHSLDIVEQAMRENPDFDALSRMMLQRGAVLNDRDVKIIQTFWGEPLR